jgi:segregation and condensation protein A
VIFVIYCVKLPVFVGPLDLLLHLINKDELDICDISLAIITEQYLNYLKEIQQIDLDNASEFLVMAASLLYIKAKTLLPSILEEKEDILIDEIIELKDELSFRLNEYRIFKSVAKIFQKMEITQSKLWARPNHLPQILKTFFEFNPLEGISLDDISKTMKVLMLKAEEQNKIHEIHRQALTISQQMDFISSLLSDLPQGVSFYDLFSPTCTKLNLIVTFLAILEMIRLQKAFAVQNLPFGDIRIYSVPNFGDISRS